MTPLLQTIACGLVLACAGLAAVMPEPPVYVVRATDWQGQDFIAGEGDTCRDAWRNAVMPANVAAVICIQSN